VALKKAKLDPTIDANKADWNWAGPAEIGAGWQDAIPAPGAAARTLVADRLPPQSFEPASAGTVVRTTLVGGEVFPARPVVVPAHTTAKLLLRRDAMISAYPDLEVAGGKGARIKLSYSEALYDAPHKKSDRDLIGDRQVLGISDTFIADGERRSFAPLWWRTWRFAEIEVATDAEPLTSQRFASMRPAIRSNKSGDSRAATPGSTRSGKSAGAPRASMHMRPTWTARSGSSCSTPATRGSRCSSLCGVGRSAPRGAGHRDHR
jgi:hypothetical protein